MQSEAVQYSLDGDVAVIRIDDGKVNALSNAVVADLAESFRRAEKEAQGVILTGRAGRLSGGFDLKTMMAGPAAARALVHAGAELLLQIYLHPRPVVAACNGHALAAGALLLLASDYRIGVSGDFKIGLNEVSIQMTLPVFGVELARARLSKRHFTMAVTQARIYDPDTAVDAGYLDMTTSAADLDTAAMDQTKRLAALPHPAFRNTKQRERHATVELIRSTLDADLTEMLGPGE